MPAKKAAKKQASKPKLNVGIDFTETSPFAWNPQRNEAVTLLAQGYTTQYVADEVGVTKRTILNWKCEPEFAAELDRLSLMVGVSSRAERLRIAQRLVRQRTASLIESDKDLLDWLKFAQSETDGAKLDLAALLAAATSMAEGRPARTGGEKPEYVN